MTGKTMTLPEVRRAGMEALRQRLGPAGMIRFLQLYDTGSGDYTKERHTWLDGLTVDEIARDIHKRRIDK